MIYLLLFINFFKTGLFSIGGGLATLPFLYEMSNRTHWFSTSDIADMIAISESTPGAIGINMSTYAGFKTAGYPGGVLATVALATPSLIIILIISGFPTSFCGRPSCLESSFLAVRSSFQRSIRSPSLCFQPWSVLCSVLRAYRQGSSWCRHTINANKCKVSENSKNCSRSKYMHITP